MDQSPASCGRAGRLGQPVHHPESVQQRACHEVSCPGRRQARAVLDLGLGLASVLVVPGGEFAHAGRLGEGSDNSQPVQDSLSLTRGGTRGNDLQ